VNKRAYKIWHNASGKWLLFKVEPHKSDVKLAEYTTEKEAVDGMARCITKIISYYDENGKMVE